MKRLKWDGLPFFNKLKWTPLDDPTSPGATGAFYKTYKNFAFYWIDLCLVVKVKVSITMSCLL